MIPGSGCAGLAPIAAAYFRGLAHADVTVLHKRHVRAGDWPAPRPCNPRFVQADRMSQSLADAQAFMDAQPESIARTPVLLVGISEGAEVVPLLARRYRWVTMVALVASTGLDPRVSYRLQVLRAGDRRALPSLQDVEAQSGRLDSALLDGRTLGYWRDLLHWPVLEPLLALEQPVWIAFGGDDASLPLAGLHQLARTATRPLCVAVFRGADHGLMRIDDAPLQQFWRWVEAAVLRSATKDDCSPAVMTGRPSR